MSAVIVSRAARLAAPVLLAATLVACSSSGSSSAEPVSAGKGTFCETVKALPTVMNDAKDPESAKVAYGKLVGTFQTLASQAPPEIAADMKLLAGFSSRGYELMKTYDFDLEKMSTDPAFETLGKEQASDGAKAASQRVDVYTKSTCGVDLSGVSTGG